MPEKIIGSYPVKWLQVLDENGSCDEALFPELSEGQIKKMYSFMVLSRAFDEKCLLLQRQGRIGTYASIKGQEASQVGSAFALSQDDFVFPSFREAAVYIARNMPMHLILLNWGGSEWGEHIPDDVNCFTVSIPVSSHIPHAAGYAFALKLKKKKGAAVAYFGDGATSRGDFHESLNIAGVFRLPVVFLCQNNQWAISMPVAKQTTAQTLAQKAIAYGIESVRVDGNDVFAVYRAMHDALNRAYIGKGPTLIECLTYRIENHTTSDDSLRYRSKEEVAEWAKKDPIERVKKYMIKKGFWNDADEQQLIEESKTSVEQAVAKYEAFVTHNIEDIFNFTYEKKTKQLEEQLHDLSEVLESDDFHVKKKE